MSAFIRYRELTLLLMLESKAVRAVRQALIELLEIRTVLGV